MRFCIDTHTHTIASGHAYSTLEEMVKVAVEKDLECIVISDHSPGVPGGTTELYFVNMRVIPEFINGVRIIKSVEANIIDYEGNIDFREKLYPKVEFIIASFHSVSIRPKDIESHTNSIIKAMENPYIDIIGHPDNKNFQIDNEKFVLAAKRLSKPIEINNHSFIARKGSDHNCRELLKLCWKHKVNIMCGSDAHISFDVGNFSNIENLIKESGIDEDLIINTSREKFEKYLMSRKKRIEDFEAE